MFEALDEESVEPRYRVRQNLSGGQVEITEPLEATKVGVDSPFCEERSTKSNKLAANRKDRFATTRNRTEYPT